MPDGAFYPVSGALLGLYELGAILTRNTAHPLPTISTYSARRRSTRVLAVGWALGLAVHLARHRVD